MRILFYYPSNKRTIPIDVALRELQKRGHQIYFLTICEEGDLHQLYRQMGAEVYSHVVERRNALQWYLAHLRYLRKFCGEKEIDIVHSHLQQTNLLAVLVQYFIPARVIVFRHHGKFHHLVNDPNLKPHPNEILADKIINHLAKCIVVSGVGVKQLMLKKEKVDERKIRLIPYMYNFEQMCRLDLAAVKKIRAQYQAKLLLIMVSRLTPYKRHLIILPLVRKLVEEGLDIRMLIMDDGPEEESIKNYIEKHKLQNRIFMLGFRINILEYIAAADILVHPSLTEASNSAVKEAGLLQKAVLVCKGVGDFDDYICHGENGFMLDPTSYVHEAENIIRKLYVHSVEVDKVGQALAEEVRQRFSIRQDVINLYESL